MKNKTNDFVKVAYGIRAIAVSAVLLAESYNIAKQSGIIDKGVQTVNKFTNDIKRKIDNRKLNEILRKSEEMYKGNPVIEKAVENTYYSECFRNSKAN